MDDEAFAAFLPGVFTEEVEREDEETTPMPELEPLSIKQEEQPEEVFLQSVFTPTESDTKSIKTKTKTKKTKAKRQTEVVPNIEQERKKAEEMLLICQFPDCVPLEIRYALVRKARVAQAQAVLKERQNYSAWQEAQRQRDLTIMRELNPRYAHRYQ
jgi:erythromycin esterase-like protein